MSEALPQLVADRYRLISPLGQGGMGRVWKARDEVLHRDVAIKELVPPPSLTDDERREMRERSLREARAIARLNHINVVRIFDVLRTDGDPWIVMEYVPSKSLQDTLAEDGPVSPARAVEIGLGVLGALKAAHKAGVMHRDVKPGNVLLGNDGRVVLTDFGLATIPGDPNVTRTGMVLGSPAYIAPERARDGTAGPEADLWSLGATLYAAVEGKSPYARPSAIATLAALATEAPPPPKSAGPLKPVLNGLLRKDPTERMNAEVAEKLLRRAGGKRTRTIPLLDGVRRPGPNGPREPRPPVVPAPRPAEARPATPVSPPVPRARQEAAAAGVPAVAEAASAADSSDLAPTAKVESSTSDAAPTAKVGASAPSAGATAPVSPAPARPVNPTSVMPAPVSPPSGRATVVPGDGTKPNNTRRNVLIGALVALLLLGLVLVVPMLTGGDGEDGGGTPQADPTTAASQAPPQSSAPAPPTSAAPSPTPSVSPSAGLPAGWKLVKDPVGFSVPVPDGWRRSAGGTWVKYEEPNGVRELVIDRTNSPQKDAVAAWRAIEPDRRRLVDDYEYIDIRRVSGYWKTCADWDWRETRDGTRIRVRNRGFVTASNRGFAIRWEVADKDWAANLQYFDMIAREFVPDRQD
ncbi:serine/threonine protein kinase [Micromonospora citrea]|uniref:non-specific serine/threonine protein kinase n=1 Tax=Micromonospora citrea TaxID=47855 RepID=A0A1C6ULX5_9ACTN|nr:serine/threonine-protein kinase [Micromonospora citrea]SCL55034.1 serine/threonine protein kinase [Micromonospora citrea]